MLSHHIILDVSSIFFRGSIRAVQDCFCSQHVAFLRDLKTFPSEHTGTFHNIAGITWTSAQQSSPGITKYITLLETAYAVHELFFALLFLIIIAIPFRRRARWAWWACWVPMLANLTYSLTLGRYDATTLVYSLIADIALPVLLLIHVPAFFGKSTQRSLSS